MRTKQVKRTVNGLPKADREALARDRLQQEAAITQEIEALTTDEALRVIVHTSLENENPLVPARNLRRHENDDGHAEPILIFDEYKPITDELARQLFEIKNETIDQWRPTPAQLLFGLTMNERLLIDYNEPPQVWTALRQIKPVLEGMQTDGTYKDDLEGDTMWTVLFASAGDEELPQGAPWHLTTLHKLMMDEYWPSWLEEVAKTKHIELRRALPSV